LNKSIDISKVLKDWPYDPTKAQQVRNVKGSNGRDIIQVRIDMGILQMEMKGRPDGHKPFGADSLLDYYTSIIKKGESVILNKKALKAINSELMQYYNRRISLFSLQEYKKVVDDANHNLKLLDLISEYCNDEDYILSHEQYRPYIFMHKIQAMALIRIQNKEYDGALDIVNKGIKKIENIYNEKHIPTEDKESNIELKILLNLKEEIKHIRPPNRREILQRSLDRAVEREDYERAAEIRDELKKNQALK